MPSREPGRSDFLECRVPSHDETVLCRVPGVAQSPGPTCRLIVGLYHLRIPEPDARKMLPERRTLLESPNAGGPPRRIAGRGGGQIRPLPSRTFHRP